jgi:hypothetical protein
MKDFDFLVGHQVNGYRGSQNLHPAGLEIALGIDEAVDGFAIETSENDFLIG